MLEMKIVNDSLSCVTWECGNYVIKQLFVYGNDCDFIVECKSQYYPDIVYDKAEKMFALKNDIYCDYWDVLYGEDVIEKYGHAVKVISSLQGKFVNEIY